MRFQNESFRARGRAVFAWSVAAVALAAVAFVGTAADGGLLVYEGFNYGVAGPDRAGSDLLHGQPDGVGGDVDAIGLGGTWQDSTPVQPDSDLFLAAGSLSFGDLPTSGNHVRGDSHLNNDIFSRPITADLSTTASGEVWFSFLANKLQGTAWGAAREGLVIGSHVVNHAQISNVTTPGLQGFGIAPSVDSEGSWTAYAWDGDGMHVGDDYLSVATNGSDTRFLVGRVVYDAGAGGRDLYSVYDYQLNNGSISGGTLSQIGNTLEVDVDQSLLNTLNVTRQVNTAFDEIRIGGSLSSVLGSEPSSALRGQLGILDLSANGGINPATGEPWKAGDQYRLAFISSTFVDPQAGPQMNDIAAWNAAVQSIADNATTHDLSSVTWNIIGSTADVDARDNTSTNPNVDGVGHAIFAMDGSSVIENNFVDLWDGNAPQNIALYDENVVPKGDSAAVDWPLTGTNRDGTAHWYGYLEDTSVSGTIRQGRNQEAFAAAWIDAHVSGANWFSSSPWSVYGMSEALTIVPEPSSALLALLGLVGLLMVRRKR